MNPSYPVNSSEPISPGSPPQDRALDVPLQAQPTDTSCGPTCLQAIYAFHGDDYPLRNVIDEVPAISGGGTLEVWLGIHALRRGYRARIYTYNLRIFDPTWFGDEEIDLRAKLSAQVKWRRGKRRQTAEAYLEFVRLGGEIRFEDLNPALIRRHLARGNPILTGLSATFLYRSAREDPDTNDADDEYGEPLGHFVVLQGYNERTHRVSVADPYTANPLSPDRLYEVHIDRLINAILLGVLTYDGNLLIVHPNP